MRAHYCWEGVTSVARYLEAAAGKGTRSFALPGTQPVYPPDRPAVLRHLHLDIKVDPSAGTAAGHVTLVVMAIADGVRSIRLDAEALDIESVWIDGQAEAVEHRYDGRYLDIPLDTPMAVNDVRNLVVRYSVERPALGLYFVGPTEAVPDRSVHVWSQNQDDDARYWFPCMDDPGMKLTTSVSATVPDSVQAISNGVQPEDEQGPSEYWEEGWHTWHWRQDRPHPIYLLSLVVGDFVETVDESANTDVRWYCLPGREADAQRTFEKTGAMIDFFADYVGVPYPWARYAQIAVSEFVFGGMENTGFTTITDNAMPDERAQPDFDSEGLIAHELAHQWFGDLVTCREWAHGWLNEGFATYFDGLWREHHKGADELHEFLMGLQAGYAGEDSSRYRRPLVSREYEEPIDLFDRHLYYKGAWVLHMLRSQLGDAAFRRGVHVYLTRFQFNQAETPDLRRAMEDATGVRLARFFDEWVYRGGFPTITWEASASDGVLSLTVAQAGGPWRMATDVLLVDGDDSRRVSVVLDRKSQTVVIAGVARMPDLIVLDPDHTLLCRMKPKLSLKLLQRLAKEAPTHPRRMDALKVLSTKSTPKAVASLIEALQSDPFWGVRKRVAGLLASVGTETARNALIAAVSAEANPRARRAIVDALGRFSGDELAYQAVFAIADSGDPSWFAEAAALESVGKLGLDGAAALLESRLDVVSFNDVIAASAISGLASLRTAGALATIGERTSARYTTHVRVAAVLAIGRLGASVPNLRPEVARVLESLLSETELRIRISLVHALRHGRLAEGRTLLGRIIARSDGRVHRLAREASLALAAGVDAEASAALRGDLEILRAEQGRLRTRLGLLE